LSLSNSILVRLAQWTNSSLTNSLGTNQSPDLIFYLQVNSSWGRKVAVKNILVPQHAGTAVPPLLFKCSALFQERNGIIASPGVTVATPVMLRGAGVGGSISRLWELVMRLIWNRQGCTVKNIVHREIFAHCPITLSF
jgi:hypothetical protein